MQHSSLSSSTKLLLAERARAMRVCPSRPELALWLAIRGGQLGVPFRRQVVLGRFIVDFLAPRARLVVEVDGPHHARRRAADARRDHKLGRMGYRVLRLEAELVMRETSVAVRRVRGALGQVVEL